MAAITINLYTVSDDHDHVYKTLGTPTTYSNCVIKEQTSVQDPVIRIQSTDNLSGLNYAYIERYGRYYYIDRIETTPDGFWVLHLHSDVLMSRAAALQNLEGTITRSETIYNGYLNDSEYKALAPRDIYTRKFPTAIDNNALILITIG